MLVEATTAAPLQTDADTLVIGLIAEEKIAHDLPGEAIAALRDAGEAREKLEHTAVLHHDGRRVIVTGLGPRGELDAERARLAAAAAAQRAAELGARTVCWEVPHHVDDAFVAGLVEGTLLRDYRFERYRPAENGARLEKLLVSAHHDVEAAATRAAVVVTAQNRARDLGNAPANELNPLALADYAHELASRHEHLSVSVRGEEELRAAGMGAFAAVARGTAAEAQLIRLDLEPPGAAAPRVGLVGKAVTFDSGGLSLKQAATMHEMKFDMMGGAAVLEAIAALAELGSPARVLGVVGATENLPSGTATRPGDIVRALDGTTVEINNTDAEGRLVLADCITYARREGAERLVDLATLTGAQVIALGSTHAALYGNEEEWTGRVAASATRTGELAWRMPLHADYAAMIKGRFAELTNLTERREAGSITGAEFLHHFAGQTPWCHLDIAGPAWDVRKRYFADRGATGYGVRLLVDLVDALSGR